MNCAKCGHESSSEFCSVCRPAGSVDAPMSLYIGPIISDEKTHTFLNIMRGEHSVFLGFDTARSILEEVMRT